MIIQNPAKPAPSEVLDALAEVKVDYIDFDKHPKSGIIIIHHALAADVAAFFALALRLTFPINHVCPASDEPFHWDDDKLMAGNITSGFNYRLIARTGRPSLHGLGQALDVNPVQNPMLTLDGNQSVIKIEPAGVTWDKSAPGTFFAGHPLVELMLDRGWVWGGNWTTEIIDYQHFQKRL